MTEAIVTAQPGTALASLAPLDLRVDVETIGSNAVAFGKELTDNGRGILLGNPHYPWQGASRFHLAHLTLPGELDVMGVGLIASPRIAIGFTSEIAWSHTVSTALRFTMFRLDLMPPSQQPSLITEKYVTNSNDSYWLSNPDMRLEGFSPIIGNERSTRSLRTRAGLNLVEEILNSGKPVSLAMVQDMLFEHRNYGAELLLDDILKVCQFKQNPALTEACDILSNWDRRQDVTSVGAHIYNEFWIAAARAIDEHFAVPFDVDDPVHTPRGLTIDSSETQDFIDAALTTAVTRLQEANVSLDAKWGDVQFALRNGEKIGIPGGGGGSDMFSVITARLDAEKQGYNPITHGNSYIQVVSWNEDGTPAT